MQILREIRDCQVCASCLEHRVNPIVNADLASKVVIIGQAPGKKVHETGKPWNDKSGERLRAWLGVDEEVFYDPKNFAIVPMGFCYPGSGKSGDLPPRPECAPLWHDQVLGQLQEVKLTLLIGGYAQAYYLREKQKATLTETVQHFESYLPDYLVLPHPSPRNNIWMKKNPWFRKQLLPVLETKISEALGSQSKKEIPD